MKMVSRLLASIIICLLLTGNFITAQQEKQKSQAVQTAAKKDAPEKQPAQEAVDKEIKKETAPEEADQEVESTFEEEKPEAQQAEQEEPEKTTEQPGEEEEGADQEAEPVSEQVQAEEPKEEETQEAEPEEKKEEQPPVEQAPLGPDEVMGIDTVDLEDPQGNWLYKRVWWERAEAKYEKIQNAVSKILEMRTGFFAKRAELDKTVLDPFYLKIGLSQGELEEILSELIARTTKEAKENGTIVDLAVGEQAEVDKKELERLQRDVQLVIGQDQEVEGAILMLVEQINKAHSIKMQAWQDFKSIARVLDDKKAREMFYKVDNAWRNIQDLQRYIEQTYSGKFEQLIERIKEQISRIESSIATLKEKGVDLKNRMIRRPDKEEQDEEQEEQPKGIITRYLIDPVSYIFQSLWRLIRWPIDKIMGSPQAVDETLKELEQGTREEDTEKIELQETVQAEQLPIPKVQPVDAEISIAPAKEAISKEEANNLFEDEGEEDEFEADEKFEEGTEHEKEEG